jgi:hypothetical protein
VNAIELDEADLEKQLGGIISAHLERELDITTVQTLLASDPTLEPTMTFEMKISTPLQCETLNASVNVLPESELVLPLRLRMEINIDANLQSEFSIGTMTALLTHNFASQLRMQLVNRPSCLQPCDRDVQPEPPLVGGSDLDLAGQVSVACSDSRLATLAQQLRYELDNDIHATLTTAIELNLKDDNTVHLGDDIQVNLAHASTVSFTNELIVDVDITLNPETNRDANYKKDINRHLENDIRWNQHAEI